MGNDPKHKTEAGGTSQFKKPPNPVADFYDSKQYTLKQLDQRIGELSLDDVDKRLLSQLTAEQIQDLREQIEDCCEALNTIESEFVEACEEADGAAEGDDDGSDDEEESGDAEEDRRLAIERLSGHDLVDAWHLLDAYEPTLQPEGKDVAASRRAKTLISSVPMACWFNARRLIEVVDEFAEAALVEGYVVSPAGRVFEHGWIVHGGRIIDPTLPDDPYEYFAGLEFIGRTCIAEFDKISRRDQRRKRDDPFFNAFGWGGHDSPHMKNASDRANERFRQIVDGHEA